MSERQLAVALKFLREREDAPKVVAKGSGYLAEHILKLAKEHGVPVHEDSDLVEVLFKLDLGETIPQELYKAIAEILAYIYVMNNKYSAR